MSEKMPKEERVNSSPVTSPNTNPHLPDLWAEKKLRFFSATKMPLSFFPMRCSMEMREIAEQWLNLPFLNKFQKDGAKIRNDIEVLKRLEEIKAGLKQQKDKK